MNIKKLLLIDDESECLCVCVCVLSLFFFIFGGPQIFFFGKEKVK